MGECRGFDTTKPIQVLPVLAFTIQSSDEPDSGAEIPANVEGEFRSENMVFSDATPDNVQQMENSSTFDGLVKPSQNTELGKFLSRPTIIDVSTWSTSDTIGTLPGGFIYPWQALLSDAVIKRKIENYAFMKATLCLKVVVNGTKFHYGALRVSYEPLANSFPKRYNWPATAGSADTAIRIAYDQTPGAYIDPSSNTGAVLKMPMLYNREFVPLKHAVELQNLAKLRWVVFQPLRIANTGATTSLTITTFAWLEDVVLSGSTNALTLQSKDEYDEAGGPVSAPSMQIAKVARSLSNVPVIGKFAKATEMGASAIGNIAKLFGFTDVPNIQDVPPMVPVAGPHLASSQISVPYQPLNLNPKAQITIDPGVHGLPSTDELAIKNIATKKCFFAATDWATSDTTGTIIFNALVNPVTNYTGEMLNGSPPTVRARVNQHTPLSFASQFFRHWRGDLIYTIKLVKSKFHSGRLKVTWDPMTSDANNNPPVNTVYTTIIDLCDRDEYEIRIPWFYQLNYARTRSITDKVWTPGNSLALDPEYDNGALNISVLTKLAAPLSTASVGILVYVRAAENFEVNNPVTVPGTILEVQSKDTVDVEFHSSETGNVAPVMKHFGAPILSLRELLRRSQFLDRIQCPASAATKGFRLMKAWPCLPPMTGYDPNGLSSANCIYNGGTYSYNFVGQTIISFIISAYAGVFGSMNYTLVVDTGDNVSANDISVVRDPIAKNRSSFSGSIQGELNSSATLNQCRREFQRWSSTSSGGAIVSSRLNNTLQINVPYLNNFSFYSTDPYRVMTEAVPTGLLDDSNNHSWYASIWLKQTTANEVANRTTVASYVAAGPDFQVLMWVFPATHFVYASSPTAA